MKKILNNDMSPDEEESYKNDEDGALDILNTSRISLNLEVPESNEIIDKIVIEELFKCDICNIDLPTKPTLEKQIK